jgi:hypothetical protein
MVVYFLATTEEVAMATKYKIKIWGVDIFMWFLFFGCVTIF